MDVERVMSRDVVSVGPDATLREVAKLLAERHVSGVPVVGADGAVLGIVSGSDLLGAAADGGLLCTAAHAMTAPAVWIGADRSVREAADLMTRKRLRRLAVSNRHGELVGIVTRADLVRAFIRDDDELERELTAELAHEGIDVEVKDGDVILRGVVATRAVAADAVVRAGRVEGVVSVRSRLLTDARR
ncbi:MAG: CBS domain-containing protein [Gaiellaceae bacterium]